MYKAVAGFFVGGLVAATVALLYAPQSGKETRREIKENVTEARQKASLAIEEAKGHVINTAEEVQGKAQQYLEGIIHEAKYKTGQLKEIGSTMADEQRTSLEHGVEEAREALSS